MGIEARNTFHALAVSLREKPMGYLLDRRLDETYSWSICDAEHKLPVPAGDGSTVVQSVSNPYRN
jgi:hypothetical protein